MTSTSSAPASRLGKKVTSTTSTTTTLPAETLLCFLLTAGWRSRSRRTTLVHGVSEKSRNPRKSPFSSPQRTPQPSYASPIVIDLMLTALVSLPLPHRMARRRRTRRPVPGIVRQDHPERERRPGDLRRLEAVLPQQRFLRQGRLWHLEVLRKHCWSCEFSLSLIFPFRHPESWASFVFFYTTAWNHECILSNGAFCLGVLID